MIGIDAVLVVLEDVPLTTMLPFRPAIAVLDTITLTVTFVFTVPSGMSTGDAVEQLTPFNADESKSGLGCMVHTTSFDIGASSLLKIIQSGGQVM
jgi:hypothetical protein